MAAKDIFLPKFVSLTSAHDCLPAADEFVANVEGRRRNLLPAMGGQSRLEAIASNKMGRQKSKLPSHARSGRKLRAVFTWQLTRPRQGGEPGAVDWILSFEGLQHASLVSNRARKKIQSKVPYSTLVSYTRGCGRFCEI